jgi:hypothetical protein
VWQQWTRVAIVLADRIEEVGRASNSPSEAFMRVRPSTSLVLVSCALACTAFVGHSAVGLVAVRAPAKLDLGKYSGQIAKLQFRAVNDRATRTTFRIDSVKVE